MAWPVKAYMPRWDAENAAKFVSVDDTADPLCHASVTTPMAQQPASLPPLVISQPVPSEQPQQAPISSDLEDLHEHFKKLQEYSKKLTKEVVKLGHEKENRTEVILKMQKFMDEYQILREEQDSHDQKFQHEVKS